MAGSIPDEPTTATRATPGQPPGSQESDASLPELLSRLTDQFGVLVRKEVELAKTEITEEAKKAGKAGGLYGGAALAAYLCLLLVSFAAAWALAAVIPTGFAFLVVALVYAVVAAVLAKRGRDEASKINPRPQQTIETLKEDAQWAKSQTR